mgnify:CR=1 FL=1|jgi:hypothetical protein
MQRRASRGPGTPLFGFALAPLEKLLTDTVTGHSRLARLTTALKSEIEGMPSPGPQTEALFGVCVWTGAPCTLHRARGSQGSSADADGPQHETHEALINPDGAWSSTFEILGPQHSAGKGLIQ